MTGKIKSDTNDTSIELLYCTKHNFGSVSKDSLRQKEHIKNSKGKCKFVKYDTKKHISGYDNSEINPYDDSEEKLTPTQKLLRFAESKILKTVRSFNSHSNVYGVIKIKEHYRVLFLGSTECRQWLITEYNNYCGKIHGKELYKNVLEVIIAKSVTNRIPLEKLHSRICFVNDEIFYNMCNDDFEIIKITKKGYSIIPNGIDNPLFRIKSNPLPQVKPLKNKTKHKNPLNELAELLKIPIESKQLFLVHLVSFFFEKIPIPIMILQGEAESAKSTITSTVKKIVDPSPENRSTMSDKIDDVSVHLFNRYLTNFDNISFIDNIMSDNLCKAITGHAYNKRELWTDDNEAILTIKSRIILNGVTLNVDQTDLISRSIFYESKYIPKSQQLTEETFNLKIDELMPYIQDQIFTILSKVLENYKSMESKIIEKERMADFIVVGECMSRELGYNDFSFVESYKNNLSLHSLNAVESYPIVNIIIDIARQEGNDFEISVYDLYQKIINYAYENSINTKSKYSKFPQSEKAVSNQIVRLQSTFRNSGYQITSRRYNSRDGKYTRNTRVFHIINIGSNDSSGTSTSIINYFPKSISPDSVEPVSQEVKQAQKQGQSGSISEYRKRASEPNKNITNQTKNNDKNTTGSTMALLEDKTNEPKKVKSVPKNTSGSMNQLAQAYTNIQSRSEKTESRVKLDTNIVKNIEKTKQHLRKSYSKKKKSTKSFYCKTCKFANFINLDTKSRVSDNTLYEIHVTSNPKHKLKYSDEVIL